MQKSWNICHPDAFSADGRDDNYLELSLNCRKEVEEVDTENFQVLSADETGDNFL